MKEFFRMRGGSGLLLGIVLIASTLRAPITSVGPVLGSIRETTGLTGAEAGILTTLPVLAFAAISPLAAFCARSYGIERSLFSALLLTTAGIGLRSFGPVWALFLGTGLLGVGIAVGNVLLPSLLKRDFPNRIAGLTATYTVTMGAVGALASAAMVPVATLAGSSWRLALGSVSILAIVALIAWVPQLRLHSIQAQSAAPPSSSGSVWRSSLAWQVTLFLGLASVVFYVMVGWLPAILVESGFSAATAGSLQGSLQLATAIAGVALGPAVRRMKDQRALAGGVSLVACCSLIGLWQLPALATLWVPLLGFGAGASFILSLAFIGLRASHSHQSVALSGMAQCVGYLLAAAGPPLAGFARDVTGSWSVALGLCIAAALLMAIFGNLAGRATTIEEAGAESAVA